MKQQLLKTITLLFTFIGMLCIPLNAQVYDFDADLEGWANAYGGANSGTVSYDIAGGEIDGALVLQRASNNSNFGLNPAGIDASSIDYIRIKFKNLSNATSFRIQGDPDQKVFSITANNNAWVTMDLLVSDIANWTGTINNLDILVRGGYSAGEGNIFIDEVEFYDSSAPCTVAEDVTGFTITEAGATQLDLSWTDSTCFDEVLVVAKETTVVTVTPTGDGTTYNGNAIFGSGTDLGTNEYAVYKDVGNSVSVTGLTTGNTYHFTVFVRKDTSWSTGVTGNGIPPADPVFEDYAGAEEADGTTTGVIEPNSNGNNSVTGWFFQDQDYSFSDEQQSTGDYSIKFDSDDAATATPYNAFLGSSAAAAGSHLVVSGQQEVSIKVYITSNPPSKFRTSIIRNVGTTPPQTNIDWDLSSIPVSQYNTWVTLEKVVTLAAYTDARFQIRIDEADLLGGQTVMYFDDITFTPFTQVESAGTFGNTTVNWEDTSTWASGVVPGPDDNVLIRDRVNIFSNITVKRLEIETSGGSGDRVLIQNGQSLTVTNDIITLGSVELYSNANAYSSLIVEGTITGNILYNRYTADNTTNDLVSSPISGWTFGNFIGNNTNNNNLVTSTTTITERLFGPFDNSTGVYLNYDDLADAATSIIPGKGYRVGRTSNGNFVYNGAVETGEVSIALTDETATGTGNYKRWNLIGNPYPSYLDFGVFFTDNASEFDPGGAFQAIYGYNGNGWTTWNNLNTTDKIAPGQGFFVRAKTGGGTATFTPAMRTNGSSDDFIDRSSTPNNILSELFLSSASDTRYTKIYFVENQTRGLDPGYDAGTFGGSGAGIYTHLVEDNTGINLAIQALPYQDYNDVVVPVGVKVVAGVQSTIGVNFSTSNVPSNINIYLEDNVDNTWTLLNTNDYTFTPSVSLDGTGRFYIHYSASVLSINDNTFKGLNIYTEQSTKQVLIKGSLNNDTVATIYDIQGRVVLTKELNQNSTTNTIDVNNLFTGIYIVKLQNTSGSRSEKIILK